MFRMSVEADPKQSSMNIGQLFQGGLGLPDRDFYFRKDPKSDTLRREYVLHVARALQIVGEAASKIPASVRARYPEVPWPQMIGLRHRLAPASFGTDPAIGTLPVTRIHVHGVPLKTTEDVEPWLHGRLIAVSTTVVYGSQLNDHVAIRYLRSHTPAARTQTFLIYDFR